MSDVKRGSPSTGSPRRPRFTRRTKMQVDTGKKWPREARVVANQTGFGLIVRGANHAFYYGRAPRAAEADKLLTLRRTFEESWVRGGTQHHDPMREYRAARNQLELSSGQTEGRLDWAIVLEEPAPGLAERVSELRGRAATDAEDEPGEDAESTRRSPRGEKRAAADDDYDGPAPISWPGEGG